MLTADNREFYHWVFLRVENGQAKFEFNVIDLFYFILFLRIKQFANVQIFHIRIKCLKLRYQRPSLYIIVNKAGS